MYFVEKAIPLKTLGLQGDETLMDVRFTDGNMVLKIAVSAAAEPCTPALKPKSGLGDWGRKWAGAMSLETGETRESLRAQAMREKFGA